MKPQAIAEVQAAVEMPAIVTEPSTDDEDDDLPRPGKVWEKGLSLVEMMKRSAPRPASVAPSPPDPPAPLIPASPRPSEPSVAALDDTDVGRIWPLLLAQLDREGAAMSSVLSMARLGGIEDGQAVIRFAPAGETFVKRMATNGKRNLIVRVLSSLLGKPMGVRFEVDAATQEPAAPIAPVAPRPAAGRAQAPAVIEAPPREPAPAVKITPELTAAIEQDPFVRAVMQELGGKIVKVE